MEIDSLFFFLLFQLLLLKMPNSMSKQKMPVWEKLLLMRIIGRIFFSLYKSVKQFNDFDKNWLFCYEFATCGGTMLLNLKNGYKITHF